MTSLAIIGGSGFQTLPEFKISERKSIATPFGKPSALLSTGELYGMEIMFLPRHGDLHSIAPHNINYRANIYALKREGIEQVISLAAVGGITAGHQSGSVAIPHQIIDYTSTREHTYFDGREVPDDIVNRALRHIDFSNPYDEKLRLRLVQAARDAGIVFSDNGVYGVTQGPRFETAAEIDRMERDGSDMVGMTAMPEAVLARELDMAYATIALVVNPAAGRGAGEISMDEIFKNLETATRNALSVLEYLK
jgi:5'-deoxy-5'-methylthioadenosine phosphorylase